MAKKLYVGNLPFDTTEDQLHAMFSAHGQVQSAQLITDRLSGQSKGFGFVEMGSDDEAAAAIQKVNGTQLGGRSVTVNEARPKEDRGAGGGGARGGPRGGGGGGGGGGFKRW